jgi:CRP-like cAMP-binding protein
LGNQGERVKEVLALISGNVAARLGGQSIGTLSPGDIVGTASAILNNVQECDFVVETPCRYIAWPIAEVQQFLDKDPDLRAQIRNIISEDIATKMHEITRAVASK